MRLKSSISGLKSMAYNLVDDYDFRLFAHNSFCKGLDGLLFSSQFSSAIFRLVFSQKYLDSDKGLDDAYMLDIPFDSMLLSAFLVICEVSNRHWNKIFERCFDDYRSYLLASDDSKFVQVLTDRSHYIPSLRKLSEPDSLVLESAGLSFELNKKTLEHISRVLVDYSGSSYLYATTSFVEAFIHPLDIERGFFNQVKQKSKTLLYNKRMQLF